MNHNYEFRERDGCWRTGLKCETQDVRFLSTNAVRIWCSRMRRKNAQAVSLSAICGAIRIERPSRSRWGRSTNAKLAKPKQAPMEISGK